MENDIVSVFLNRKRNNISDYACVFAKYALNNNLNLNKVISKIVEIYIKKYYLQKNLNFNLLNEYFISKQGNESTLKDILTSSILFYKNSGLEENISRDINTIVILSNLIYLAVSFDSTVDEYLYGDIELDNRIELFLSHFSSKIKVKEEDYEAFVNELKILAKKECTAYKKFWKCLNNDSYKLDFYQTVKNDNFYFVKCFYDIKLLNRYDKKEIEKVSLTKGIIDDIYTIYLEQLSITILKNLLHKHYDDRFFINIDSDYFNKNKNITNIDRLTNNECTKKCIVFIFDFNSYKTNMNLFKTLKLKGYKLGIRNIPNETKLNTNMFDLFDYVFINSFILDKYKDFEDVWKIKNVNFIIDNESFIKVNELDLLNRKR